MDNASGDGIAARSRGRRAGRPRRPRSPRTADSARPATGAPAKRPGRTCSFSTPTPTCGPAPSTRSPRPWTLLPAPRRPRPGSPIPTARCSPRSSGCPRRGGSSARARAWRFSPAAGRLSPGTRRPARTTARPRFVEAVKGAALLVRRADFEAAGGFDEDFFLYAEETDLIARWRRMGRSLVFEPARRGRARGRRLGGRSHSSASSMPRSPATRPSITVPRRRCSSRASLSAGAALRYAIALLTPGEQGRARRARYRAALSGARQRSEAARPQPPFRVRRTRRATDSRSGTTISWRR